MHASEVTREVVERANDLYWGSDESVNQIAGDLDLSKGALYGIIEPEPSGRGCPLCGDEVVYANRTARDRGTLACPTCDWDGAPDEAMVEPADDGGRPSPGNALRSPLPGTGDHAESGLAAHEGGAPAADPQARSSAGRTPHRPLVQADARTIAGGALLGAAVGLALVLWARRR